MLTIGTDSYITLEGAAAYLEGGLLPQAWTGAEAATREAALREAYRALDCVPGWQGVPYLASQAGQWPRVQVFDENGLAYRCGDPADPASYPLPLQQAQCEEALERLRLAADAGYLPALADRAKGIVDRRSSEGAEVRYAASPRYAGLVSARAYALIRPLLLQACTGVAGL